MKSKKEVKKLKCLRCGHTWNQRGKNPPKVCMLCKSKYWNVKKMDDIVDLIIS